MDLELIRRTARKVLEGLLQIKLAEGDRRRKIGYREFFPIDLETIVTSVLGWKLRPLKNYDQRAKSDFHKRIIFLNLTGSGPGEKRYSLAHEIGHAALHGRDVECYGGSLNRPLRSVLRGPSAAEPPGIEGLETDAERFAAELLMPEKPIREHFELLFGCKSLHVDSLEALLYTRLGMGAPTYDAALEIAESGAAPGRPTLTQQFGTSRSAMARRLTNLKLVRNGS